MAARSKAAKALEAIEKRKLALSLDPATGEQHEFWAFRPWPTMPAQQQFLHSDALLCLFSGANKIGKSFLLNQKGMIYVVGEDPTRPGKVFPAVKDRVARVWLGCRPKNTRDWLRDVAHRVPPGIAHKVHWSRGEERIEFAPTARFPKGLVYTIKSYGMDFEEWQKEIVDLILLDEPPDNPLLFPEIQQRLLMSRGQLCVGATFTEGIPPWFYEICYRLDPQYEGKQDGPFMWCRASQRQNPLLRQEDIDSRKHGLTEDQVLARIDGEILLLFGRSFFRREVLDHHWQKNCRPPSWSLTFTNRGDPIYEAWTPSSRGWKVWEKPIIGGSYVVSGDPAGGNEGDNASSSVFSADTGEQVATFSSNEITPPYFGMELGMVGKLYNWALLVPEINFGEAAMHVLREEIGYPRIYMRESFGGRAKTRENTYGWRTSAGSKRTMMNDLALALERGMREEAGGIVIRDAEYIFELRDFGLLREKRPGMHGMGGLTGKDDRAIDAALAVQGMGQAPKGNPLHHRTFVKNYARRKIEEMQDRIEKEQEQLRQERSAAMSFSGEGSGWPFE